MAFKKKTWKDRKVEFPGRRLLNIIFGPISGQLTVDVSRAEGNILEAGDALSGKNLNDFEQRVEDGFNEVVSDIYVGTDGKLHKVQGGADTVLPFRSKPVVAISNLQWTIPVPANNSRKTTTANLSSASGYKNLTADNILLVPKFFATGYTGSYVQFVDKTYNPDAGILTCTFDIHNDSTITGTTIYLYVDIVVI